MPKPTEDTISIELSIPRPDYEAIQRAARAEGLTVETFIAGTSLGLAQTLTSKSRAPLTDAERTKRILRAVETAAAGRAAGVADAA